MKPTREEATRLAEMFAEGRSNDEFTTRDWLLIVGILSAYAEQCAEIERLHSPEHLRGVAERIVKDVRIYDALTDAMGGK